VNAGRTTAPEGLPLDQQRIDELYEARSRGYDPARPEAVAKVRASGHMTARERITALLDPGSAVEFGVLQGRGPQGWVHTLGGVDFTGTVAGHPVVTSSTDYSDRGGGYGAGYLARLFSLALQNRWPAVLFVDGGGSRAQSLDGPGIRMARLQGRYPGGTGFFEGLAALAGWVPLVAVVSGPSFAGHATLAATCDVIITTAGSAIGMGGPPMVEAGFGTKITPTELGGVDMHEQTGGIDLLVRDETAALAAAKRYLSYYYDEPAGQPSRTADTIRALVPEDGPYDMHGVIAALVDEESCFELRPNFARSLITAFARIDGRSVGVLANQPMSENGGAIDSNAANKIARFVQVCDSYGLPILSLMDSPGLTVAGAHGEQPGMTRHHARPIRAMHHRSVPLISVQVRKARGLAAAAMSGIGTTRSLPDLRLAWPTVELGVDDRYAQGFDDVVDPAETRDRIRAVLRLAPRIIPLGPKTRPRDSW
jgi:acetyl-CoA carboxylase carboxyltransferase component